MKLSIFQMFFLGCIFLLLFYNNFSFLTTTSNFLNSFLQNLKKNISIKK